MIIAVDPGFGRCGIALMENTRAIESACIETDPRDTFPKRLCAVVDAVELRIKKYAPTALVLEKLFFSKNQRTAMQVAETRGGLIYLAAHHCIEVVEYAPREIKQAVTGNGAADKRAVALMVSRLVKLPGEKPLYDDEYDAIAIGLAHAALAHPRRNS